MKKSILVLFLGCCIFQSAIAVAKHVLPVFSGYFMACGSADSQGLPSADFCKPLFVNSCNYLHTNYFPYKAPDELTGAKLVLKDALPRADCKWDDDFSWFSRKYGGIPNNFPGTIDDWKYIRQQDPVKFAYVASYWKKACQGKDGHEVTFVLARTSPVFQCPDGSRFASVDKDDGKFLTSDNGGICVTKPTFGCLGDVVGRDLDSHGFGPLGHVGVVSRIPSGLTLADNDHVIEALDAKPVIQENTGDSFESLTKYWGARYGLKDLPETQDMDWFTARSIINNARSIAGLCAYPFGGVKYDLTPGAQHLDCKFDPESKNMVAVVRCDFLVNEAYKATAGVGQIVDYGLTTTPAWLFNNLILGRFDADHPQNYPIVKTDPKAELDRLQRKLDHASWYLTERYMEDALAGVGSYDILTATVLFQQNSLEPNIEKARFLWNLALKYRDDEDGFRFKYLIDGIADLKIHDAELTDEMISEYYRQTNVNNKSALLWSAAHVAPARFVGEVRQINEKIKKLYDDAVFHETNLDLVDYAITWYPFLSNTEKLALFDQVFQRPDIGEALKKKMFMPQGFYSSFYSGQLYRVFSSSDFQKKHLQDFINQVEKYGDKRFLTVTLCNVFVTYHDPLNNQGWTVDFDPEKLDDSVRPILLDYLKANVPDPFGNGFSSFGGNDRVYYQWLRTYIAVQSKTLDESLKRTAYYIKGLDDLPLKALLLENSDDTLYKTQFSTEELEALLKTFKEKARPNMFTIKNGKPILNENYMKPNREMLVFGDVARSLERRIKERSSSRSP